MAHTHLDWQTLCRAAHKRLSVPAQPRHRVHVVACHFNPHGWRAPIDNLHRFRSALPPGTPVTIVEASYTGRFEVPDAIHLQADPDQVLWQKERMLRVGFASLPPEVDRVAWIDADCVFANKHFLEQADELLDTCRVVQLFDTWLRTDAHGRLQTSQQACAHQHVYGPLKGVHKPHSPAPGGAWAGRRDVAEQLWDSDILGSGDWQAWLQWTGNTRLAQTGQKALPPHQLAHYLRHAESVELLVRGRVGCVPGLAVHWFHGEGEHRRHREKWQALRETDFDPRRDIEIAGNGLWRWTGRNPALQDFAAELFALRREDG